MGHVASALHARETAQGGTWLLRIEDIDQTRCRPEYEVALIDDLRWLGFHPDETPRRQSDHLPFYRDGLERLKRLGVLYPCTCTRQEISARAGMIAPDGGPVYPGICRNLGDRNLRAGAVSWRLDMQRALTRIGGEPGWLELGSNGAITRLAGNAAGFGDVVIARKDSGVSYHLCVTHDDALQDISIVTRGRDLYDVTAIHRVLQCLLDYPEPVYAHHPLILDDTGRKLSKRDGDITIRSLKESGMTADAVLDLARAFLRGASHPHHSGG